MLKLLIITIILVGLAIAAIAIKMFVKKDGEFKKSCGSVDPTTGQNIGCTCGNSSDEACENKLVHNKIEFKKITVQ